MISERRYADLSWQERAACTEAHDPEVFFDAHRFDQALAYCAVCPVIAQCRAHGRKLGPGVWGGQIQGADNKVAHMLVHGTEGGYNRHRRRKERPCGPCAEAARVAFAERLNRRTR